MVKNLSSYATSFVQLYVHHSNSFVQTINGIHLNIAVVSISGKPARTGYSFAAAGLIAASIANGQPGTFPVPVGGTERYQVTITPINDIPPVTIYNEPSETHLKEGYGYK